MSSLAERLRLPSWAMRSLQPFLAAYNALLEHKGMEMAGYLAFMAVLSIFPFLIFLAALFGVWGTGISADELLTMLFKVLPPDVAQTINEPILRVMRSHRGDLLTVGIVGTLWAASSGVEAIRAALNEAYCIQEPRAWWWRRLHSLAMVLITAGFALVASIVLILGPVIWQLGERVVPNIKGAEDAWFTYELVRYAIGGCLLFLVLVAMHQWLPNVRQRWSNLLPGVALTLVLWIVTSTGLSIYLSTLGNYNATYGALGGVVVTLLFFYFSSIVFIFGAELNAALHPVYDACGGAVRSAQDSGAEPRHQPDEEPRTVVTR